MLRWSLAAAWGLAAGLAIAACPTAAFALDLTAGSGAAQGCPASGSAVSMAASAVAYTEPLPVLSITDYGAGHYHPATTDESGIGIGFAELSGDAGGWCAGVLYRIEYHAQISKDLLDILVANHFGHPFDAGRLYRLSMSEKSFKAEGLRLRKALDFALPGRWSATLGVGASVLKATQGEEQSLSGAVTANSPTFAVGTATWLQTASNLDREDFNPFVAAGTPQGEGFSTDLELQLRSSGGVRVDLTAMDPLGRIYWSQVPRTFQTLNTASVAYNANFDRDAFVNGIDSRAAFVETIPVKLQAAVGVPVIGQWQAQVQDDWVDGLHFPAFGVGFGPDAGFARVQYDLRTRAIGVGGQWRMLSISVTSNEVQFQRASALGASIRITHSW